MNYNFCTTELFPVLISLLVSLLIKLPVLHRNLLPHFAGSLKRYCLVFVHIKLIALALIRTQESSSHLDE